MSNPIADIVTKETVEKCLDDGNYIRALRVLHFHLYGDELAARKFAWSVIESHAADIAAELEENDFLLAAEAVREMDR